MKFYVLDERDVWFRDIIRAAKSRGFDAQRIFRGEEVKEGGYGFIRCHADPTALKRNQADWDLMSARLTMIQDETQVRLYESKSGQFRKWWKWMPDTWRFEDELLAIQFLETEAPYPLVSKADIGASSVNVRILKDKSEAIAHVRQLFGGGILAHHCAGSAKSLQKGYALLQRFIPHDFTWRVNAIGNGRAIFKRHNYPDKPVAQTGNTEPVMQQMDSLLEYADRFFAEAGTKWCAIDVLQDGDGWRLLETSLAWPWPSPGRCNEAPIFRTKHRWLGMFDAMMDEIEQGTWSRE